MKSLIRFLARLYPSDWRKRYGAEFDALLEEAAPSAGGAFDVLWSALRMQMTTWNLGGIALAGSVAGVLVAAAVSFALPPHYLSQAILMVTPGDESVPANESVPRVVEGMEQNLYSRDYLASVIHEHNLFWRERLRMPLDDVIAKMRKDISVVPLPRASSGNRDSVTFVIQFDYSDPCVAQQVNEELTSRLIEGGLNSKLATHSTFWVPEPPSLPLKPAASNRARITAMGLFAGLLVGVTFAILLRSRRSTTAS
jgi:hypothetical protein